jgi:hypothetical protein
MVSVPVASSYEKTSLNHAGSASVDGGGGGGGGGGDGAEGRVGGEGGGGDFADGFAARQHPERRCQL